MTRVPYEIEGWGTGEVWLDGTRLVWHELPRPTASEADRGTFPHPGGGDSHRPLRATLPAQRSRMGGTSASIAQRLVHRIECYFAGEHVGFDDVEIDADDWTTFQLDVLRTLRSVPYGEVVSYGELAGVAGHPSAQRAAGTFCAQNRYPLVVPCHRVVSASGLGGYGSLGREYKRRLLELEGVAV